MAGAMTAGMVYLGPQTGLFRAMQASGPLSASQIVSLSGLQERYVEEWLKGMTSAGYLDYDPAKGTFSLPEEHAYFLASEGTDHFVGGLFAMVPPLLRVAPQVAEAFRKGNLGIMDYARYRNVVADTEMRQSLANPEDGSSEKR